MLEPPSWPKIGDLQLALLWKKNSDVFLMSNQEKIKNKKRKRGLEAKRQETPKNEQGKMKTYLIEYTAVLM